MNKFILKDINYTGCHPDIANALRQGKMIKCKVASYAHPIFIVGYSPLHGFQNEYMTFISRSVFVEPITPKRILKDPVSIMKILVEEGWHFAHGCSEWYCNEHVFSNWSLCGKEDITKKYPENFYTYEEC